jgi:RHS repeat-associated protein
VYGKVASMHRIDPVTGNDITVVYSYDAMGNRISKATTIKEALAHPTYAPNAFGSRKTTYYVRDAQGNVLSVYDQKDYVSINAAGVATVLTNVLPRPTTPATPNPEPLPVFPLALTEQIIYGSSRIGAYKPQRNQKLLATDPNRGKIIPILAGQLTLGYKSYELSNHLGNVLTTITDNKIIIAPQPPTGGVSEVTVSSVVLTTQDYYPFGMAMTERGYQNVDRNAQRYGFNNQEIDDDLENGAVVFKYRIESTKLCRFWSVDPLTAKYPWNSPYAFAENRVIDGIDLEGAEFCSTNAKEYGQTCMNVEENKKVLNNVTTTIANSVSNGYKSYMYGLGTFGEQLQNNIAPTLNRAGGISLGISYTYVHGSGKFDKAVRGLDKFPKILGMESGNLFASSFGLSIAADHQGNVAMFYSVSSGLATPNSGGFSLSPSLMLDTYGKSTNIFSDYAGWGITYSGGGSLGNPYTPSIGGSYFQPLDGKPNNLLSIKSLWNDERAFDGYSLNIGLPSSKPSLSGSVMVGETKTKDWMNIGNYTKKIDKIVRSFLFDMQIQYGLNTGY